MEPARHPHPGSNAAAASAKPHSFFRDVPWLWRDVLMAFAPQLVIAAAATLQPVAVRRVIAGHWVPLLLLQQLWMIGYMIWATRRRSGMLPAFSPWRVWLREARWLPLLAPGGLIILVAVPSVVASVDRAAANRAEGWMPYVGAASRGQIVGFIVIALIGAPIAEELCFRGLLYNKLRQKLPGFVAVLVQAALFGLSHAPLGITLVWATGAAGLAFGLVYQWRKTLVGPILMHSSVNAVVTALMLASMAANAAAPQLGVYGPDGVQGCVVTGVVVGSAAERAGLKSGDVVTSIDAQPVRTMLQLIRLIRQKQLGDQVTIEFNRDGKREQVAAVLTRPKE
jgi:membrane protease YdiL (CAAX protease family)